MPSTLWLCTHIFYLWCLFSVSGCQTIHLIVLKMTLLPLALTSLLFPNHFEVWFYPPRVVHLWCWLEIWLQLNFHCGNKALHKAHLQREIVQLVYLLRRGFWKALRIGLTLLPLTSVRVLQETSVGSRVGSNGEHFQHSDFFHWCV